MISIEVEILDADGKTEVVEVRDLKECNPELIGNLIKEGEESHRKEYRCVVVLSRALTASDVEQLNGTVDLVCQQLTPMRVLHRRTLMVRERTIHAMHAEQLAPRFLQLRPQR